MRNTLLILTILASNLSYAPAEAYNGQTGWRLAARNVDAGYNCGPFGIDPGGDCPTSPAPWFSEKSPVPYAEYWDNDLNQTAQQYVAIMAMLQQELAERELQKSLLAQELESLRKREEENRLRAKIKQEAPLSLLTFGLALLAITGLVLAFMGIIPGNRRNGWYTFGRRRDLD